MTISSRTPERQPFHCAFCGDVTPLEPSSPAGDAVCPRCGHLVGWFQAKLAKRGLRPTLSPGTSFDDLGLGSLEIVELFMSIEEDLDVELPEDMQSATLAEIVRYIVEHG